MYYIRYVLARPVMPKSPKLVGANKDVVSTDKRQDTTASAYLEACSENEQEPDEETLEHFRLRDQHAWTYRMDFPVHEQDAEAVASELAWATRSMRKHNDVPGRNTYACRNPDCDWLDLCHANPEGDIGSWWGVTDSDYDGLKPFVLIDRADRRAPKKTLERDKPGAVISSSELQTYLRCQRKWWFEYVKKKKVAKSYKHYSSRMKGTFCHLAAEIVGLAAQTVPSEHWHELTSSQALRSTYSEEADKIVGKYNFPKEEVSNIANDIWMGWYVGLEMFRLAVKDMKEILLVEDRMGFILPGTKTWMTGKPDIVTKDSNGNIYITDYKTTNTQYLNKAAEKFRHNPQPYFYLNALEKGFLLGELDVEAS